MTEIVNDSFVEAERAKRAIHRCKDEQHTVNQIFQVCLNLIIGAAAWWGFTFLVSWANYGIGVAPIESLMQQVMVTVAFRIVSVYGAIVLGLIWIWYSTTPIYDDANIILSRIPFGIKKFREAIDRKDEL